MAAVNGLNTTSMNDLVHTEGIAPVILQANEHRRVFQLIGWVLDASETGANVLRIPGYDSIDVPSGTKTETDEQGTYTDFTTSKAEVTAGVVIVRSLLSDELEQDGKIDPNAGLARQMVAMSKRMDKDLLALHTSATNTSDSTGVTLTLDLWDAAKTAYMAQLPVVGPTGFHAWVAAPSQVGHLQTAIRTAGGGSLSAGAGLGVFNGQPMVEYQGRYNGIEIFQGNVPQNDASNWSSAFLCAGPEGALAMGVWWAARGTAVRVEERTGAQLVTTSRFGVTISRQANIREFISKKT